MEVDPPHGDRADKGRAEGSDALGGPRQFSKSRPSDDDRFTERDDDKAGAALGHMAALDNPIRHRRRAVLRNPEPRRR